MDSAAQWQQTLQRYREKEIAAIACDEADIEAKLLACASEELPPPITAFLQRWQQTSHNAWQALLQLATVRKKCYSSIYSEVTPYFGGSAEDRGDTSRETSLH